MITIGKTNRNGYTYVKCDNEKEFNEFIYDENGVRKSNIEDWHFSGHGFNLYAKLN